MRRPGSDPLIDAIAGATISAFFCFGGWWEAGKIAGEVRNPSRNLSIAFSGGVLIVTAIYLLLSFAFVAVVPMEQIQSNTAFVAPVWRGALRCRRGPRTGGMRRALCPRWADGAQHGGAACDLCARARRSRRSSQRGPLAAFARLHPRFGTPANAVLLQTGMALLVLSFGAFDRILAFIIFSAVVFLALTVATLFRAITPVASLVVSVCTHRLHSGSGLLALMLLMHDRVPLCWEQAIVLVACPFAGY